jgi:hypothetical protein
MKMQLAYIENIKSKFSFKRNKYYQVMKEYFLECIKIHF